MSYRYGRRRGRGSSAYTGKCKEPEDRPDVARRLVGIIAAQRRGHERPAFGHRSGRIDRRNLWRAATGDPRVFSRPGAPSPTHLRLVVLLDLSGSMAGEPASNAAQMGWDLVSASLQVPTVTCEVWGQTTADLQSGDTLAEGATKCREGAYITLAELWKPGQSKWQYHRNITRNQFWGNEDGWAIKVLADDVMKRMHSRERLVLVVVSDGEPVYHEMERARGHVRGVVNAIRRKGHVVISVSVSSFLRKATQEQMYGHDSVIEYTFDTNLLTQAIARVVGKALN